MPAPKYRRPGHVQRAPTKTWYTPKKSDISERQFNPTFNKSGLCQRTKIFLGFSANVTIKKVTLDGRCSSECDNAVTTLSHFVHGRGGLLFSRDFADKNGVWRRRFDQKQFSQCKKRPEHIQFAQSAIAAHAKRQGLLHLRVTAKSSATRVFKIDLSASWSLPRARMRLACFL